MVYLAWGSYMQNAKMACFGEWAMELQGVCMYSTHENLFFFCQYTHCSVLAYLTT